MSFDDQRCRVAASVKKALTSGYCGIRSSVASNTESKTLTSNRPRYGASPGESFDDLLMTIQGTLFDNRTCPPGRYQLCPTSETMSRTSHASSTLVFASTVITGESMSSA